MQVIQTRTRHESGWTTVDSGGETLDFFYVKDDCGAIRVRPEGAKLECVSVFDETCSPPNALSCREMEIAARH